MDDALPSYVQATTRDHWAIISSFVRSQDLCSAALVSRSWNRIFNPQIWGNPASHFGTENDAVYVALVRFKRTLSWARSSTRELTHTWRLPPAHAEIYEAPRAEWLRDILLKLPRLQSLIVSRLPIFDHGSLMGLSMPEEALTDRATREPFTYSLRLLEAINCFNSTSTGLASALRRFPSLTYLDLSYTGPSRDHRILASLAFLPSLQILKLRGIHLRDEDVQVLSRCIGLKVRSLDVRDNKITNSGLRNLLQHCVIIPRRAAEIQRNNAVHSGGMTASMQLYFGSEMPTVYSTHNQDLHVRGKLTSAFFHRVGFEDACGAGITHLYVSGNSISASAVADVLSLQRLHVFDVGTLLPDKASARSSLSSSSNGAEQLVPLLESNGSNLSHLRLDQTCVTHFTDPQAANIAELDSGYSGALPAGNTGPSGQLCELEGDTVQVQELPADSPVFELEGSPVLSTSQPVDDKEQSTPRSASHLQLPGSARFSFIPSEQDIISPISSSPLLSPHIYVPAAPSSVSESPSPDGAAQSPHGLRFMKHRTYSGVLADHESRIEYKRSQPHGLLPSMIPNVQSLELTDVPLRWPTKQISDQIIAFITACAEEAYWSRQKAQVDYSLPPGGKGSSARRIHAQSYFKLRKIVLEMRSPDAPLKPHTTAQGFREAKSSVEDPDCEALWQAAADDFSFFGDKPMDECGVPETETAGSLIMATSLGKMVVGDNHGQHRNSRHERQHSSSHLPPSPAPIIDVLSEISNFRKNKKAEYQMTLSKGEIDPYVEGYWEGIIVVIRANN